MKRKIINSPKLISIIIPAYKQEKTIVADVLHIQEVLSRIRRKYELIVVVDGMIDKTFENCKKIQSNTVQVIGYEKNRGKGYAIRYGMVRSKGDVVGFIDAGMDLNPSGISMLLEYFDWYDADIIVGSKMHPLSHVNYPTTRRIISRLSQMLIFILFKLSVRDTQVGMKFFRRDVIEDVMPRLLVKQFAFDIELLAVSYYLGYKKIYEAPIELVFNKEGSGISQNLFRALMNTLWDTLAIFYRLKIRHYYGSASRRRWKFDPELNFKVNTG